MNMPRRAPYLSGVHSAQVVTSKGPADAPIGASQLETNRSVTIPAAAEFIVRRCFYQLADRIRDGFYITFYLFGYGDEEAQARQR